jgi:hypothetical protein
MRSRLGPGARRKTVESVSSLNVKDAEGAKLRSAGIIPKLCLMEGAGTETMDRNESSRSESQQDPEKAKD